ncbi:MAG: TIGR03960 family B12-binding radical SAM protein [Firmicutes bacterium]|nr:TIGR03960 family B12-binding radical SAM protein [Candidatus Colimorpha enterica]
MNDSEMRKLLKNVLKPGRYTGGEYGQIIKDKKDIKARVAFCFPDTYEIGMSNLGVRLLYGSLNKADDVWCERVYAPWDDMEEGMRRLGVKLYAHESHDPIDEFDFVAFTLQYELCYTNVLNMLELGGIPLLAKDRDDSFPVIVGGGPCAYNAEPVADFFDVFSIGEGEEALPEMVRLYINMKDSGSYTKAAFLRELAKIPGFYVPSLYDVEYNEDGTVKEYRPKYDDVPKKIVKRIIKDMDKSYFPDKLVMPYIETVHDRVVLEVYRGCIRGCRFCQAGMIFRPVREKSPDVLNCQARTLYENTGYDEITLSSLSISDYSQLDKLTDDLLEWTDGAKVNLSLPSLRIDSFTKELMDKVTTVRTGGITFAPEAGTQRLRDTINKNVCEEDLMRACRTAFEAGKRSVKLYFMDGLPTETLEDIDGIADLAKKVAGEFFKVPDRARGKGPQVTISVSCFIPKPFTPFQWEAQDDLDTITEKQDHLMGLVRGDRHISYNWHDAKTSRIEAVFARGNRRLSAALLEAHKMGMKFDSWDEHFSYDNWMEAFEKAGIDPAFYANRRYGEDEVLPWDIIDIGVTKAFFLREKKKAYEAATTPSCREQCSGCGANRLGGERSCCPCLSE